jgi:hypothetical protein
MRSPAHALSKAAREEHEADVWRACNRAYLAAPHFDHLTLIGIEPHRA